MSKKPLVSIIVPVYNVKKYLERCLDSILAQTYKNIEIILVDDGSTDGSEKLVDKYDKKYKRIKAIYKNNGGLSSARNVGIKHARGAWLMFVDSDDYIRNDCVSNTLELITDDVDIVTFNFKAFSDDASRLKHSQDWPEGVLSGVEAINDMFKNKRPAYICMSMFRASLFKKGKIEFPENQEFEDIAVRIKLLYNARKVAFTNEKLYRYLIRRGSITGGVISGSRCEDFLKALEDTKTFLSDVDGTAFTFLDYFELHSLVTLLNYIARDQKPFADSKKYWSMIRKQLRKKYFRTSFPTLKNKLMYGAVLSLSCNRRIYSALYRRGIR